MRRVARRSRAPGRPRRTRPHRAGSARAAVGPDPIDALHLGHVPAGPSMLSDGGQAERSTSGGANPRTSPRACGGRPASRAASRSSPSPASGPGRRLRRGLRHPPSMAPSVRTPAPSLERPRPADRHCGGHSRIRLLRTPVATTPHLWDAPCPSPTPLPPTPAAATPLGDRGPGVGAVDPHRPVAGDRRPHDARSPVWSLHRSPAPGRLPLRRRSGPRPIWVLRPRRRTPADQQSERTPSLLLGPALGNLVNGLSYGWWVGKHNAHHAHPNDLEIDPDVASERSCSPRTGSGSPGRRGLDNPPSGMAVLPDADARGAEPARSSVLAACAPGCATAQQRRCCSPCTPRAYVALLVTTLTWQQATVFVVVHQALFGIYLGCSFAPGTRACRS